MKIVLGFTEMALILLGGIAGDVLYALIQSHDWARVEDSAWDRLVTLFLIWLLFRDRSANSANEIGSAR